jgi:type I restriction enzyme, S subunit
MKYSWIETDLSNLIAIIESGGRPKGGVSENSGDIPSLGGENIIQAGGVDVKQVKKIPLSYFERMKKGILEDRDVLINKDGANTGKVGLYIKKFPKAAINEHLIRIRGHEDRLSQDYLYYLLLSEYGQKKIRAKITGSAQPGLKQNFINSFPVFVPTSKAEQIAITDVLSTIDQAITQTKALIAKYQRIKTGMMQDLLTRGIDENGELRNPVKNKFKPSALGMIPEDWGISSLGTLSKRITSGSRGWAKYYSDGGSLFLRIGNLTREHINLNLDDVQHVKAPSNSEAKRTKVEPGDLLISITADLGIIGVIPDDFKNAYINQHISLVKLDTKKVNPWWVGNFLAGPTAQKYLWMLNDAGAKAGLNLPTIASLPILTPNDDEQNKIASMVNSIDQTISILNNTLEKYMHLISGVMQDLLSVKVSVYPLMKQAG